MESRAKSAANAHKLKEVAARRLQTGVEREQQSAEAPSVGATSSKQTSPVQHEKPLTIQAEKEQRKDEAEQRKVRGAENRAIAAKKVATANTVTAARSQKIADVAALSAAAQIAAAPVGDVAGLTPECPKWIHDAATHLQAEKELGMEWDGCVKAWVMFEIAMGFADLVQCLSLSCLHQLTSMLGIPWHCSTSKRDWPVDEEQQAVRQAPYLSR